MRSPELQLDPNEQASPEEASLAERLRMAAPPAHAGTSSSSKAGASTSPTSVLRPSFRAGAVSSPSRESASLTVTGQGVSAEHVRRMCDACGEVAALRGERLTPGCDHDPSLCAECLAQWIQVAVDEGGDGGVRCPMLCGGIFEYASIAKYASPAVFARFERFMLNRAMEQDGEFRWCARPGCGNGQSTSGGADVSYMTCNVCEARTCLRHRCLWHQGMSCAEYDTQQAAIADRRSAEQDENEIRRIADLKAQRQRLQDELIHSESKRLQDELIHSESNRKRKREVKDEENEEDVRRARKRLEISNLDKELEEIEEKRKKAAEAASMEEMKKYKRCPKCARAITKTSGCDHMTCSMCRFEFCIQCLAPYRGPNGIDKMGARGHEKTCEHYSMDNANALAARRRRVRRPRQSLTRFATRQTATTATSGQESGGGRWRITFNADQRHRVIRFITSKLIGAYRFTQPIDFETMGNTVESREAHFFITSLTRQAYFEEVANFVSSEQLRFLGHSETVRSITDGAFAASIGLRPIAPSISPVVNTRNNDPNFTAPRGHPDFVPVMNPQHQRQVQTAPPVMNPQYQRQVQTAPPVMNPQHQRQVQTAPQIPDLRPQPTLFGNDAGIRVYSPHELNNVSRHVVPLPGSASTAAVPSSGLRTAAQVTDLRPGPSVSVGGTNMTQTNQLSNLRPRVVRLPKPQLHATHFSFAPEMPDSRPRHIPSGSDAETNSLSPNQSSNNHVRLPGSALTASTHERIANRTPDFSGAATSLSSPNQANDISSHAPRLSGSSSSVLAQNSQLAYIVGDYPNDGERQHE